jgi:hypothetical protein
MAAEAVPRGLAVAGLLVVAAPPAVGRFCAGAHTTSLGADVGSAVEVPAEGLVAEARAAGSAQQREARPTVPQKRRLLVR